MAWVSEHTQTGRDGTTVPQYQTDPAAEPAVVGATGQRNMPAARVTSAAALLLFPPALLLQAAQVCSAHTR
jgi:hypothetical protein